MRNRGRRSRGSDDINLTPLLDVLFVILFIVMLTGTQTEKNLQESAEASESRITGLQEQVTDLEEQNNILQSEVNRQNKIEDSGKRYESDAVIVTFMNESTRWRTEITSSGYIRAATRKWSPSGSDRTGRSTREGM